MVIQSDYANVASIVPDENTDVTDIPTLWCGVAVVIVDFLVQHARLMFFNDMII